MRKWYILPMSGLATLLVACGGGSQVDGLESLPTLQASDGRSEQSVVPAPLGDVIASGQALSAGRLAFIGDDNNVYVLTAGSDDVQAITTDAAALIGGSGREYGRPTWSTGGWLSYVEFEFQDALVTRQNIYAVQPGGTPRSLFESGQGSYIYGYWSPSPCNEGRDCGRLSYLVSGGSEGLQLRMAQVRSDTEQVDERLLGVGGPFYYSWSPDGESMLWHRNNRTLTIIDVSGEREALSLSEQAGAFQAPWWSPEGNRLLYAELEDGGNQLVVTEGEERTRVADGSASFSAFAWSPDGSLLALAEGFAPGASPFTSLSIYAADGRQQKILLANDPIWSYFWSPNSEHLAIVTVEFRSGTQAGLRGTGLAAPAPQEAVLVWSVADVATGEVRKLAEFVPTRREQSMFQNFDQFAQSHSFWSPDGQQIVYSHVVSSGEEIISVIDALVLGAKPEVISKGSIAVFSYN